MKVQIGDCTLYQGDCLEIMPTLGKVDAVVTDPPYGVNLKAKRTKHNRIEATTTYRDDEGEIRELVLNAFDTWCASNTRRAIVTPGIKLLQDWPKAKSIGTVFCANGAGMDSWGFGCNHPILYYGTCPYTASGLGSRPNSFYSPHPGGHVTGENKIDHPCPKPLAWMNWLVNRASFPGHIILDPFMGSGTTGVACVKLGRKFIGIELELKYFDIACKRIEDAYKQPDMFVAQPGQPVQLDMLGGGE